MAILFDASSSGTDNSGSTSAFDIIFSHTVASGANYLRVSIGYLNNDRAAGNWSVDFNGVSMSPVTSLENGTNTDMSVYDFELINPASGTHDITVSVPASSGGVGVITCVSNSFFGVDPALPSLNHTTTNQSSGSSSLSTNINTTYNNSWVYDSAFFFGASNTYTNRAVGASQTERGVVAVPSSTAGGTITSTEPTTTPGTYTMSWSTSTTPQWVHIVSELKALDDNNAVFFGTNF